MSSRWERLTAKLHELADVKSATSLLGWDQLVMMPRAGGAARSRALATMESIVHDRLVDPSFGELIQELSGDDTLDDDQKATLRVLRRDYEQATKMPPELVRALAEAEGLAYEAWAEARPAADFSLFQEQLETLVRLKKEQADALGFERERYDALLDLYEPAMTTARVEQLFDELLTGLRPIADAVLDKAGDRPAFLNRSYDTKKQESFSDKLVEKLDFDLSGGRLDTSPHPFTAHIAAGDVRQTTRFQESSLLSSIYATMHETGHALYDQGIPEPNVGLPIGRAPSLGFHESQSILWENNVGRSRAFTDFLLPQLKDHFPEELGMLSPEEFYAGVNHPQRTLIRVDADELTYNFHIALRVELELGLFRDELAVGDLPDAWDAAMEKHLGIRPENHSEGVLQDMHWAIAIQGYFPTYTLGTLYASAFFKKAQEELGDLADELRRGDSSRLLAWLRENVHRHGYRYEAPELAERILGAPLTPEPFLQHLRTKYNDLYALSL